MNSPGRRVVSVRSSCEAKLKGDHTVQSQITNRIGVGLYSQVEAARLLRIRPETVARWSLQPRRSKRVFTPVLEGSVANTLSFTDLVQLRAVRLLRAHHHIPLDKIRQAVRAATEDHGINQPLAHPFRFAWFDKAMLLEIKGEWIGLTGKDRGQQFMREVVTPNLRDLRFSREDGLATRWVPMASRNLEVVLDPAVRLGQPVIMPGAALVESVASAVVSEGSVKAAAAAFDLSEAAVDLAWRYYDSITGVAA